MGAPMDPDRPPPGAALFDDSRWPLLVLRLPGTLSRDDFTACLDMLSAYLRRGEPFVIVVDLARVGLIPLEQRWRQVEWLEEHEHLTERLVLGATLVVTSPLVRLSLSAIMHFKRLPLPVAIRADLPGALAWALAHLGELGLAVPPPPPEP